MALSFGRKKDSDADAATTNPSSAETNGAPAAPSAPASGSGSEESLDESWFETAFAEEAASPTPSLAVSAPTTPPQSAAPLIEPPVDPDFTVFDPEPASAASNAADDDFGGFGLDLNAPATGTPANSGAFADPAGVTPFDSVPAEAAASAKKGGAKKLLPVLALLVVVGGGGAFWFTQMNGNSSDIEADPPLVAPAATAPAPQPAASQPAATAPGRPPVKPLAAQATKKTPTKPGTTKPNATKEPPFQARIGRLWAEGVWRFKHGDKPGARAKWEAAIKLAKSKPGYEKSAAAIQEALDKKLK